MSFLTRLTGLILVLSMAACGGGGGSPGATSGSGSGSSGGSALTTTAPSTITMQIGSSQSFTISGGTGPYTAVTDNAAILSPAVSNATLTIGAVAPGSASVIVRDSKNTTVSIGVTVVVPALGTTAPASLTLPIGAANSQVYVISGGSTPYTATSSNVGVVAASVSGSSLTLTGVSVGSATIVVRDKLGATLNIAVTAAPTSNVPLFTTAPSSLTVVTGSNTTFSVGGGTAPYIVTTSNASVAAASVAGNSMTITGISAGSANIVVRDTAGTTTSIAVTVTPASNVPLFTTAPSALVVAVGSNTTFSVGGGTAPYVASTSNASVATVGLIGNAMTINGQLAGSASILVRDAAGATTTIAVTVSAPPPLQTSAPSPVTIALGAGNAQTYSILGGTAPYRATSSNVNVAAAQVSGSSLTVVGINTGSANILAMDNSGSAVTVSVTVTAAAGQALFTTAPSALTSGVGVSSTYSVGGGTSPYSVTSSNVSAATASVVGNTLTLTGVAPGVANLVIRDAAGTTVTVGVTVASSSALSTTAPSTVSIVAGAAPTYTISGGTGPYTATSSNTSVAATTVSGTSLTITGVTPGNANVVVRDSTGATVSIATTVTGMSLFTTAPSSVTVATGAAPVYSIGGGSGPYSATSSNVAVATVSVLGTSLTITGAAPGNANVVVRDAAGATQTIAVTVNSGLLSVSPNAATALIGDTLTAVVSGGTPPYTAQVTNTAVATASVTGSMLTVNVSQQAASVPIIVTDSKGLSTSFTLTSSAGQPSITMTPLSLTISELNAAPIRLTVSGNVGAITAFSSDTGLLITSVSGNIVTVTPANGMNTCIAPVTPGGTAEVKISVIDSTGALASTSIVIVDSIVVSCP